jgi:thiol:disulfide interchange protein DsbA
MTLLKRFNPLLTASAFLISMLSAGQALAADSAVANYKQLENSFTVKSEKMVVTEFFSYGCPHCASFEPFMAKWEKEHASTVVVERVPVGFQTQWIPLQKLYFAMQEMGVTDTMSSRVFDALHKQHKKLYTDSAVLQWAATEKGLDVEKLTAAYQSFSVARKVAQADKLVASSRLEGVPGLVVNGKYLVNNEAAKSASDLTAILDSVLYKTAVKK